MLTYEVDNEFLHNLHPVFQIWVRSRDSHCSISALGNKVRFTICGNEMFDSYYMYIEFEKSIDIISVNITYG